MHFVLFCEQTSRAYSRLLIMPQSGKAQAGKGLHQCVMLLNEEAARGTKTAFYKSACKRQ